jgi:hypothetical protein
MTIRRLQRLAEFLSCFEKPDHNIGNWIQPPSEDENVFVMPHFSFSKSMQEFINMAYDEEWVLKGFDWPTWKESDEAQKLRDDFDYLAKATPAQLARLLTVLIRQERFCEGSLSSAYESGLITEICRRAARLVSELEGDSV